MSDIIAPKSKSYYLKRERALIAALGLSFPDEELDERSQLAKYISDIELTMLNEQTLLFTSASAEDEVVTPMNIVNFISKLITDSQELSNMAITLAPVWTFDRMAAFVHDLEKVLSFGDSAFRQSFVVFLRLVTSAQERGDMVALSDLFAGECPSLLRLLLTKLGYQAPNRLK